VVATLALFIALGGASIAAVKLPKDSVGSRQLKSKSVGPRHVKPGAIGAQQLQPDSVGAQQLIGESVGTAELKKGSVGSNAIGSGAVGSDELKDETVGTIDLVNGAVSSGKLGTSSVNSDKVKDGSLEPADFAGALAPRLFAHVNSAGVLGESANVENAGRVSKGQYFIRFNRELRGCVAVASVGFGFGPGVIGAGGTAQARMNLDNDPNKVGVTVYRKGFTFNDVEDNDVNVIVMC
jgi:hypothetical protein